MMDPLDLVIRRASQRLGLENAGRVLGRVLAPLGVLACLIILTDKLFFIGKPAEYVILAASGAAAALATAFALRGWPSRHLAAVEIDERLRLSERISSALMVRSSAAPMAAAAVDDARSYARNVSVAETFPIRVHRGMWVFIAFFALAVGLLAFLPQWDLLARKQKIELARREKEAVRKEAEKIRAEVDRLRRTAGIKIPENVEMHLDKMEEVAKKMETGELKRPEAMARLGEISESIRKASQGMERKAVVPEAVARKEGLEQARELAQALEAKDFKGAAEALKKLAEKAAAKETTPKEREKIARELAKLSKSINEKGELSDSLADIASQMGKEGFSDFGEVLNKADLALDKLEDMQEQLALLEKCQSACSAGKGGLGTGSRPAAAGIYTQGEGNREKIGPGMRGPGIGAGGKAPVEPHDVSFQPDKIKGNIQQGRAAGSFFVDGNQVKGEAKAQYKEAVESAQAEAAQALEQEQIPRALEQYVRDYFYNMKKE